MTSWIKVVPPSEATGKLANAYENTKTPQGKIDNVMKAHSLRPHTMEGHAALYKAVLHHSDNGLPKWFLEVIGTYTSILNNCDYSVAHHAKNTLALLGDEEKGSQVLAALHEKSPEKAFSGKYLALLQYTEKLTVDVVHITEKDLDLVRLAGADDTEILEANQVCGYFNYVNRHLNGLGVSTEGDSIGRYGPSSSNT